MIYLKTDSISDGEVFVP